MKGCHISSLTGLQCYMLCDVLAVAMFSALWCSQHCMKVVRWKKSVGRTWHGSRRVSCLLFVGLVSQEMTNLTPGHDNSGGGGYQNQFTNVEHPVNCDMFQKTLALDYSSSWHIISVGRLGAFHSYTVYLLQLTGCKIAMNTRDYRLVFVLLIDSS